MLVGPEPDDAYARSAPSLIAAACFGLVALLILLAVLSALGMGAATVVSSFVILMGLVMAGVAMAARAPSADAHLIAGRSLSPLAGGAAGAASLVFAVAVFLPGLLYQHGVDGFIVMLGLAGGLVLQIVLVGPALHRTGSATLAELAGRRFGRVVQALLLLIVTTACMGLLVVTLAAGAESLAKLLGIPTHLAVTGAALLAAGLVIPGGARSLAWTGCVAYMVAFAAITLTLAFVTLWLHGNPVPHLAYGGSLAVIAPAEERLIEAGLVDFGLFKPFLKPFLSVDALNWLLISLALAAAVAVFPPLLTATQSVRSPWDVRRSMAWTLTLILVVMTLVPAAAAVLRTQVYEAVAADRPFGDLPAWVQAGSRAGAVQIYGVSLAMANGLDADEGAATEPAGFESRWRTLDDGVRDAVLAFARSDAGRADMPPGTQWTAFADVVLPVAAKAAGNDTGRPDLAAFSIEPGLALAALPGVADLSAPFAALMAAALAASLIVGSAALLFAMAAMMARDFPVVLRGTPAGDRGQVALIRVFALLFALGAGAASGLLTVPADTVLIASLTLLAVGVVPVVALAVWVTHATAWGVVAGIITGLGLAAYYAVGTTLYSVTFYDTFAVLSSAPAEAHAEFEDLKAIWFAAEGDARITAYNDLAARALGGLWSPGIANWFGVATAAVAVIACPIAILVAMLVSLLTGGRSKRPDDVYRSLHPWARAQSEGGSGPPRASDIT